MSQPDFLILEKIGTYQKLMRHLGNMRHYQKLYKETKDPSHKTKAESFERDLDRYIEEYFKPINLNKKGTK